VKQQICAITVVVPDYDEALRFYVGALGFDLVEDTPLPDAKRWVVVTPPGSSETRLLLARADNDRRTMAIGNQAGGRVFLFLQTDDFDRDHTAMTMAGVTFLEEPRDDAYGRVAVFADPFGNKWDLIQPTVV